MLQAVIFDMDGTLIDSEPMWKAAEKQVFSSVGVHVSEELSAKTAVMTKREVTEFWFSHFPWSDKSLDDVENEVVDLVAELIAEQGQAMPGVKALLDFLKTKNLKIGLATNAPARLIPVVLDKLAIADYFHATSSSEQELAGKPDPAVYLRTIEKLNVDADKSVAFEDSLSGIMAAKNANMKTVVVPQASEFADEKYQLSHLKLRCLSDFNDEHFATIANCVAS
ncbi:hexitol phosphatase HxpB [Methylophaga sp. OBS3]|uniref:hexitol phosphatase HxpB n=1 Tax=Methylophaga sp. OBS3 TaxID=2991934 RepID=UPI00225256AC|nr:hexitol phosphatase HxpB [Methylophaga sp. OBS3]MCX4190638.1 hexitol phosphatase HxpB [Methylophaga sp. OBS3]